MATSTENERVYPKRKRKEISYYESDLDGSDIEQADSESEEAHLDGSDIEQADSEFEEDHLDGSDIEEDDSEFEEAPVRKKHRTSISKGLPKKDIFPFEKLAAELRNKIYCFALTSDSRPFWLAAQPPRCRRVVLANYNDLGRVSTNLLALNRQINSEASPVLYGGNTFAVRDTIALHAFCATIGPKNCATLRELIVGAWVFLPVVKAFNHPAFTLLASAVNLTCLKLDGHIHWKGSIEQDAKRFYRAALPWLEAVGLAKGRRDAAVDIVQLNPSILRQLRHLYPEHKQHNPEELRERFQIELKKLLRA